MESMTKISEAENNPRSRRALLAGVVGGLGAWLVSAAQRAMPAEAAVGDPIRIGQSNSGGGSSTELRSNSTKPVFRAIQVGGGTGLRGESTTGRAVMGTAGSQGTGLWGYSPNHNGVFATTDTGICVNARAVGSNSIGLFGDAQGSNSTALVCHGPSELFGKVLLSGALTLTHTGSPPGAPPGGPFGGVTVFARDMNGKKQLAVRFPTGDIQVLAAEL